MAAAALVIAFTGFTAQTGRDSSAPAEARPQGLLTSRNPSVSRAGAEVCHGARKGVRYYRAKIAEWREKMGAGVQEKGKRAQAAHSTARHPCPRYLVHVLQRKARAARLEYRRWWRHHFAWWEWMPDKWQRIGACETGYGRRPGDFHWNSGPYQGFAGFAVSSWDAFRLPGYPSEAYLATPRQQFEVALAIWRRYGFSGWGCRNA